jgi:hypothetical protein
MDHPTLSASLDAAEKHLAAALMAIDAARNTELDALSTASPEMHRRHLHANRILATAADLARKALETITC